MLVTKIQVESVDKTGAVIMLKETTGVYSVNNPTGYGFPNPATSAIQKIIFTISRFDSEIVNRLVFVRTFDPSKPQELTSPTIDQIALGAAVRLDSILMGISTASEGLKPFRDSVYDINEYSFVALRTDVVGNKGEPFIIGTGLTPIIENNYSILIGDDIYDIDKSKPDNGGTVLYLTTELKENTTSFYPGYRANIKALVTATTDFEKRLIAAKLAGGDCADCYEQYMEKYSEIRNFVDASRELFLDEVYKGADDCIRAAYMVAKTKCKCI